MGYSVQRSHGFNWSMIAVLLIGAWLRWSALSPMQDLLSYDEAYNGLDALSLLHEPRLTPFFPDNFGRESGWMYILTPFVTIFDARPIALRLAATMVGILALAATYALSQELIGPRGATWAAAVLAVLYWAMHISTLGLRANLMVLIGALALAAFLRSVRTNRTRWWIGHGAALGALTYTYFAARTWLAVQVAVLIGLILLATRWRRGAILALATAGILAAPLTVYTLLNPDVALNRIADVGVTDISAMAHNVGLWLRAFLIQGDSNLLLNPPGRPIFDPLSGIAFFIGLVALPGQIKRRWQLAWLAVLSLAAVAPSILSGDAPHFLRAIGLVIPLSVITGAGVFQLERIAARLPRMRFAAWLPISVIAVGALITYNDFHTKWLQQSGVMAALGRYDQLLVESIKHTTPETIPVYLPFSPYTPLIDPRTQFHIAYLSPRPVAIFNWRECTVLAEGQAVYSSLSSESADFVNKLAQVAEVKPLGKILNPSDGVAVFDMYQATSVLPKLAAWSSRSPIVFDQHLELRILNPISATAQLGDVLPLRLAVRALRPLDRDYSVFVHLYDKPPESGGRLLSQGDSQLCASYPTHLWSIPTTVVQNLELPVPEDLLPGTYIVAIGVYDSESLGRLPVQSSNATRDYFDVQHIQIRLPEP